MGALRLELGRGSFFCERVLLLRSLALCWLMLGVGGLVVGCAGVERRAERSVVPGVRHYAHPGDADALAELIAFDSRGRTKLPPEYVLRRLRECHETNGVPEIAAAFERVLADDTPAARDALVRAIGLDFVHRADTSSLDLLGQDLSERFRTFDWQHEDYPGGDEGPNEMYARTLADALDAVTPERRANRAAVAVIRRDEATDALWGYMLGQWRPVPGEGEWKLNRHAVGAYLEMRDAAAADGVDLTILSGHRDPAKARANAARVGNSYAVASFSSHSLGLAIDFELTRPTGDATDEAGDGKDTGGRFRLSTRPMGGVVDMRRSPVHKWLHLHGYKFGWYPFQHEPWHWEYNPPGFRDVFFEDYPDGAPPRAKAQDAE